MKVRWISQNLPYPPKTGVLQRNYNLIREASRFADVHLVAILKQDILPGFDEGRATRELQQLCTRVDVVRLAVEASRLRFLGVVLWSVFTEAPFTANWAVSPELRAVLERALDRTCVLRGFQGGTRRDLSPPGRLLFRGPAKKRALAGTCEHHGW